MGVSLGKPQGFIGDRIPDAAPLQRGLHGVLISCGEWIEVNCILTTADKSDSNRHAGHCTSKDKKKINTGTELTRQMSGLLNINNYSLYVVSGYAH